ncbi:cell wall / vacuolar inhibitor of fructosidase 2-like [Rhodamnia argentea]|uniref:Cell wall / vacuolar inhibitor of fructosidase 2-like n=1 Tax=Rhodamnia argentea TaxID=178133 RepID=A0ABM3HW54_9MYRT|nr:cell wall / vacuolar inhibitor of fructosidase 2-like [Rhodamnia argentea]
MSELVNMVCKQATDYTFCTTPLYPDPQAPDANDYTLACIVSGLVHGASLSTLDYSTSTLTNITGPGNDPSVHKHIQQCRNVHKTVLLKLEEVSADLDSKSFFGLAVLAMIDSKARTIANRPLKDHLHHFLIIMGILKASRKHVLQSLKCLLHKD